MKITFHGAAGTVTGSRYLVEENNTKVLVDCGLFQGLKTLRLKNWKPFPFDPKKIDAVLITHAHLDHSGAIPILVREGFKGPIYCSSPTVELCKILLKDSAHILEEDARYANKKGYSKHHPAKPLYTSEDVERCLQYFQEVPFQKKFELRDLQIHLRPMGHILGASSVVIESSSRKIQFSGDIGKYDDLLMKDPSPPEGCDTLIMESTYGSRVRKIVDPLVALEVALKETFKSQGIAVIPAFAVGRSQYLLYCLYLLLEQKRIPNVPIYLDSPMSIDVTDLYKKYMTYHKLHEQHCSEVCLKATFIRTVEQSKSLLHQKGPMILISSSGMLTGGRVLHHIKNFATDPRNSIILAGFQAPGTRGALLASGAESLKIHGEMVPIKAKVLFLESLSAHADQMQLLQWISRADAKPKRILLTHGEPESADILRSKIEERFKISTYVPEQGESVEI